MNGDEKMLEGTNSIYSGGDTPTSENPGNKERKAKFEIKKPEKKNSLSDLTINLISLGVGIVVGIIAWILTKDPLTSFTNFGGAVAFLVYAGLSGYFVSLLSILMGGWHFVLSLGFTLTRVLIYIPFIGWGALLFVWFGVVFGVISWFMLFLLVLLIAGTATMAMLVVSTIALIISKIIKHEINPKLYRTIQIIIFVVSFIIASVYMYITWQH